MNRINRVEITRQRAVEDQWGEHPECPVEVLADGSQVWRVPPDTEVLWHRITHRRPVKVRVLARKALGGSEYIRITGGDSEWRETHWTRLQRLDYTPAPAREEVPATTGATG